MKTFMLCLRPSILTVLVLPLIWGAIPAHAALVLSVPDVVVVEGAGTATIQVFSVGDPGDGFNGGALAFGIGDGTATNPSILSFDPSGTLLDAPISLVDSTPGGFPAARLLDFSHPPGNTSNAGPNGLLMTFSVDTSGLTAGQSFGLSANFLGFTDFTNGAGDPVAFSEAAGPGFGTLSVSPSAVPEPTSILALAGVFAAGGIRQLRRKKRA